MTLNSLYLPILPESQSLRTADCVLECAGNVALPCHKHVISSIAPALYAARDTLAGWASVPLALGRHGPLFDASLGEALLFWVYRHGEKPLTVEEAKDLAAFAHTWGIRALTSDCDDVLAKYVASTAATADVLGDASKEPIVALALLATQCELPKLLKACESLIIDASVEVIICDQLSGLFDFTIVREKLMRGALPLNLPKNREPHATAVEAIWPMLSELDSASLARITKAVHKKVKKGATYPMSSSYDLRTLVLPFMT